VKLTRADQSEFSFQIEGHEKHALFKLLELYPLVPAGHQKLSKNGARPEDEQLLQSSINSQREENKRQVLAMMNAKSRFQPNKEGYRFTLKAAQVEWLLQVLNDIRIGSWLLLGAPDKHEKTLASLNERTAANFWAMEIAGLFESVLLDAVSGGDTSPPAPPESD